MILRHHFLTKIRKWNLCLFDVNLLMCQIHCKKLLHGFEKGDMQGMARRGWELKGSDFVNVSEQKREGKKAHREGVYLT